MKNYSVKQYERNDYKHWNAFVCDAKNATFLFHRHFMEYHGNLFSNHLLIVLKNEKWVAVIPANTVNDVLHSHQGPTYGRFVLSEKINLRTAIGIFKKGMNYLKESQIATFQLKLIPSFYCDYFSDETAYLLFLIQAKLWRRDCVTVIDLKKPFEFSKERKQCIRRGIKNNLIIREDLNFELFWNTILIPNLQKKHGVMPVHSLDEIIKLQQLFPENIRHFNVYHQDKIVAGTTIFITAKVAHPQYISGNDQKNQLGSLDYLYHFLITEVFQSLDFFDFGISNEENGKKLNEGLLFWKETFGGKTVVQDYYEIETEKVTLLDDLLI